MEGPLKSIFSCSVTRKALVLQQYAEVIIHCLQEYKRSNSLELASVKMLQQLKVDFDRESEALGPSEEFTSMQ